MASKVETILEEIKGLSLLEASELVRRWKRLSACRRSSGSGDDGGRRSRCGGRGSG